MASSILIVDDEARLAEVLAVGLEGRGFGSFMTSGVSKDRVSRYYDRLVASQASAFI